MFDGRVILAMGIVSLTMGCASGTLNLAGDIQSGELAIITAAHRFYLFADYDCGILQADSVSKDSHAGAKTVKVPEGTGLFRAGTVI